MITYLHLYKEYFVNDDIDSMIENNNYMKMVMQAKVLKS